MKKCVSFLLIVCLILCAIPSFGDGGVRYSRGQSAGAYSVRYLLEKETMDYMGLPGVSFTQTQIDSLNANIRAIKNGSTVTIASATVGISNVDPYRFLTNPTYTSTGLPSNDLRWIPDGYTIRLTDTGGKVKTVTKGANGTVAGETYGANIISANADFSSAEPPGVAYSRGPGWTITGGVGVSDGTTVNSWLLQLPNPPPAAGGLYVETVDYVTFTAGQSYLGFDNTNNGATPYTTTGTKNWYKTVAGGAYQAGVRSGAVAFNGAIDNLKLRQVLTPSLTGTWYTAVSEDAGYNPNTAQIISVSKN